MVILEDTRQQVWDGDKHRNIHRYCQQTGIQIIRQPLPYGDYAIAREDEDGLVYENLDKGLIAWEPAIICDTKRDVLEIISNIMSPTYKRFRAECQKAQAAGSTLVILVEEALPEGRLDKWKSPVYSRSVNGHRAGDPITRANPASLRKALITIQNKYGVKFRFCDGRQTGKQLIEYLTGVRQ